MKQSIISMINHMMTNISKLNQKVIIWNNPKLWRLNKKISMLLWFRTRKTSCRLKLLQRKNNNHKLLNSSKIIHSKSCQFKCFNNKKKRPNEFPTSRETPGLFHQKVEVNRLLKDTLTTEISSSLLTTKHS